MTTPSLIFLGLSFVFFSSPSAHANAAQQCKQKADKLKKDCDKAFQTARDEAIQKGGEFGDRAQSEDAINKHAGSFMGATDQVNEILGATEKYCEKKEKECEQICKEEKGKDAKEKQEIAKALKDCKEKIGEKKKALQGGQGQNKQAKQGAEKTQGGSGSDKKQEGQGGEQKQGGQQGGPPPGGAPPQSPPTEPKTAETQPPTKLPGDVSGARPGTFANNECNGSDFGGTNPNCIPGSTTTPNNGTAVASVEDPLKKKCLSGDNSPECQAYRASTAGLAPASAGGAGGGTGGALSSSGQARLDPDIRIPDVLGTKEGQGPNINVDGAGGHSGYGGPGGSGSSLEESLFGNRNSGSNSGAPAGRGFATASAVASDVAANPGPSVISIVSNTIRNWCASKAVPNCGPRPGK